MNKSIKKVSDILADTLNRSAVRIKKGMVVFTMFCLSCTAMATPSESFMVDTTSYVEKANESVSGVLFSLDPLPADDSHLPDAEKTYTEIILENALADAMGRPLNDMVKVSAFCDEVKYNFKDANVSKAHIFSTPASSSIKISLKFPDGTKLAIIRGLDDTPGEEVAFNLWHGRSLLVSDVSSINKLARFIGEMQS